MHTIPLATVSFNWLVKRYLADVRDKQSKARAVPRQAVPILLEDLVHISSHIHKQLLQSET